MKIGLNGIMGVTISLAFSSCINLARVNNTSFERAATLGKGNIDVTGGYSVYGNEEEVTNKHYSIRAGYGVSPKTDVKLAYEYSNSSEGNIRFYSVIPKFGIKEKKWGLMIPLTLMTQSNSWMMNGHKMTYHQNSWSIGFHMIHTYTNPKNTFDLSFAVKADYYRSKGDNYYSDVSLSEGIVVFPDVTAGFSKDLDKWAIRPKFGYIPNILWGGNSFTAGLGFSFTIPRLHSKK